MPARFAVPSATLNRRMNWSEPSSESWVFDRAGVRAVDRAAIDEFGIPGVVLMENAARGLADQAIKMLPTRQNRATGKSPVPLAHIICGSGNNGGDGYALARQLHNRGVEVAIVAVGEPPATSDAGINREICRRMGLTILADAELEGFAAQHRADLIVDAIFGTGLDRPIIGRAADIITWINATGIPVLAADVPSGLDCDTGEILGVAVRAACTVTFVGRKIGFNSPTARQLLGEVIVADIGAPRELIERFGKRQR